MPTPALPRPHGRDQSHPFASLVRHYNDALGRPLIGTVSVIATQALERGNLVVPAGVKADVDLISGTLQVNVLPGAYRLLARLHSADGHEVVDDRIVTVVHERTAS